MVAAHAFAALPAGTPFRLVDLLGHSDPAAATALLAHDLQRLGQDYIECQITTAGDAAPAVHALRGAEAQVVLAAGFELMVDRVGVSWQPEAGRPAGPRTLAFRPVSQYTYDELVEIFAAVGDGSLDAHMIEGRAVAGRTGEAADRLDRSRAMKHDDDWFVIGVDTDGEPAGYVLSAIVDRDRPVLAEIGVVAGKRGRHLVDELLGYGTRLLADGGAPQIRSDVDAANHPMRAAFGRAGYQEFAIRRDYRWRRAG